MRGSGRAETSSRAWHGTGVRAGLPLPEIFPVHGTGIVTGQDAAVTAFDRGTLRARFGEDLQEKIAPFLARPFDLRFLLYSEGLLERPRRGLMSHMRDGGNLGLLANHQWKGEPGVLATRWMVGHKVLCPYDVSSLFPLYLGAGAARRPNLAFGLRERLGHWYGDEPAPEAILSYVYAVLTSASPAIAGRPASRSPSGGRRARSLGGPHRRLPGAPPVAAGATGPRAWRRRDPGAAPHCQSPPADAGGSIHPGGGRRMRTATRP